MTLRQSLRSKNIFILFMVILLSSLSVNLASPVWPLYITSLGASVVELGYIFAISNGIAAFVNIVGGLLSDRYGRRKLNALGTLLGVFPPLFYILAKNWVDLIPWASLSGLATGLYMPIRWSIIADSSADQTRAMTYSWMNIAFLLGSTVAPFLGGLIADIYGLRVPFILCFALMASCFIFSLLLQESRIPSIPQQIQVTDRIKNQTFLALVSIIMTLNVIQAIGIGLYGPITPLFLEKRFMTAYTDVGILYAVGFGLSSMVVQIPGGRLATKYDRKKIILVTIVLSAPFFGLFALSRSFLECILLMFLSNLILNISWPAFQDLVMTLTPPTRRGLVNGLSATSFWSGMTIGSALSGILWESYGMFIPYYVSGVMVLMSALPIILLKQSDNKA